ncbi:MAG: hypothetical protein IPM29_05215 [Planctomycetes bacterium]|nr:hypothetical protein [Planctomycetota bacterium]
MHATSDAAGPFSSFYKGDAPYWLQQVARGPGTAPVDGLPLRPPAMRWLVGWLWDGTAAGVGALRSGFVLIGALWAPLTYLAMRRAGATVAHCAAGFVALGSAPLFLAASPNAEAPYAVLVAASILALPAVQRGGLLPALAFGAVQGLGCLLRAEHVLTALAFAGWLAWTTRSRGGRKALLRGVAVAVGLFAATLPWNLRADTGIERFVGQRAASPPRMLDWEPAALAELEQLAPYLRGPAQRFIEATVAHRGGAVVAGGDVARLHREAFGAWPIPAPAGPVFVALYGPLNFALANGPQADGGFSSAALTAAPPLEGGPSRYPPDWLASLPRDGVLALEYPPHALLVADGYGIGLDWITAHPGAFVDVAARKLAIAWCGAAHGLGGNALPLGAGGERRAVDLVVADGPLATPWRIALLAILVLGAVLGRSRAALAPWLLHGLCIAAVTVGFFGYARQGALWAPLVGAAVGLVAERLATGDRARRAAILVGLATVVTVLAVEVARYASEPRLVVDGQQVRDVEPLPPFEFRTRRVEVR